MTSLLTKIKSLDSQVSTNTQNISNKQNTCHGGLVAHNIEYDMVSPWEMTGFLSI